MPIAEAVNIDDCDCKRRVRLPDPAGGVGSMTGAQARLFRGLKPTVTVGDRYATNLPSALTWPEATIRPSPASGRKWRTHPEAGNSASLPIKV